MTFTVDSTRTSPAKVEVDIEGGNGTTTTSSSSSSGGGGSKTRKPVISQKAEGIHEVTYVPPPVGEVYQVG